MDRIKKLNGSMIAAIVLSVLLIMSVTAGATLAWFASRDSATASLTMGEAVVVTIGEDYKQGDGSLNMALPVDPTTNGLLPGMSVTPNIKVQLQGSNTNALLRARFITTVEYPDNYVDAAFADTQKYQNSTSFKLGTNNKVLDDYNVYAGVMYYDYYNSLGQKIAAGADGKFHTDDDTVIGDTEHSVTVNLTRVEVRDEIANKIGKADAAGQYTINGITVQVTHANAAELEIRQRGVDLTDAINRVLSGERGYSIHPETGLPTLEGGFGIKYSRRVADGWAYRQADQAWYYLGSSTNGFVLQNQSGTNEAVTSIQVAKDITSYANSTVGNVPVKLPQYELTNAATNTYKPETGDIINGTDKSRNYLGNPDADNGTITAEENEKAVLSQPTIASIDLTSGDNGEEPTGDDNVAANVSIDFLTKRFVLPTFINNDYAKAKVTFTFKVEAVQDYLIDPLQEATSAADRVPNNLVNAILVFNNAFPQALVATETTEEEDKMEALRATGTVANILPNGGLRVSWSTVDGTATVTGGTQIVGETTDIIEGFGIKTDDYNEKVADYTKTAEWVWGTASSVGVKPYVTTPPGPAGP